MIIQISFSTFAPDFEKRTKNHLHCSYYTNGNENNKIDKRIIC